MGNWVEGRWQVSSFNSNSYIIFKLIQFIVLERIAVLQFGIDAKLSDKYKNGKQARQQNAM